MALSRTWYNSLVDDDGTNTVGTIWDKAAVDHVYDDVDAELARLDTDITAIPSATGISTVTTTGTIATLPIPSGTGNLIVYMNNASAATIHGIAPGLNGQRLTIYAVGAGVVNLAYFSASAGATNQRLVNVAGTAPTPISTAGSATYLYDTGSAYWRLNTHEQGAWITPTFAAGNFTGGGSMTWTVDSGDVVMVKYRLSGKTLAVSFVITTTSVGGTPTVDLRINNGAWGGFSVAGAQYLLPLIYKDAGGALTNGFMQAGSALGGSTWIGCYKAAAAVWSAATNTTDVYGTMSFEVS